MADGDVRFSVIDAMLDHADEAIRNLAFEAIDAMLETSQVSSSFQTDFGTRHQHREWRWRTVEQRTAWFEGAYGRLESVSASDGVPANKARSIIATNARSNVNAGMGARTVAGMRAVRPTAYWDTGWRAANEVLHFDRKGLPDDIRSSFEELELELRPKKIDDCFEAFVLGEPWRHWHPRGNDRRHTREVQLLARGCGVAVAKSGEDISSWIRRATGAEHGLGPIAFGRGLASRVPDLDELWSLAVAAFRGLSRNERGPALLKGIIEAAWQRDRAWTEGRLIEIAADADLAEHTIALSPRDAFDAAAVDRLINGMTNGTMPPERVGGLMYGGVSAGIAASDLARLLDSLIDHPEGAVSALNVLFMRRFNDAQNKRPRHQEFDRIARRLLVDARLYESEGHRVDHELAGLARALFPDAELAHGIASAIVTADREQRWKARDLHELKKLLIEHHLQVVLDDFVAVDADDNLLDGLFDHRFADDSNLDGTPTLDKALILNWIGQDLQIRALKLASLVPYAISADQGASLSWSPLALAIMEAAPDPTAVLAEFESRFYSGVSTGPFYLRFERRLPLIDVLIEHQNPRVRSWARETRVRLEKSIKVWQDRERDEDSRFE